MMKRKLPIYAALCALFVLITASSQVIVCASEGLRLCGELIVPSLFPFFVVSLLLGKLGFPEALGRCLSPLTRRLFHVSGKGATALFIGLTGGYPMGAAYLAELLERGEISPRETERLLGFCNNSGPAFLVGAIGAGVFDSAKAGLLLYIAHIQAALASGILLRSGNAPDEEQPLPPAAPPLPFARALSEAVRGAVPAILSVCGFVILFTVFTGLLEANGFLELFSEILNAILPMGMQRSRALLLGFWELGSGVGALRGLALSPSSLALAAGIVGWGGVSVLFQSLAALADLPVKTGTMLLGRVLSAGLGAGFAWVLGTILL